MEACVGNEQEDRTRTRRRRRRRRATTTFITTVFLCGILIFTQFGLSASSALSPDQYHYQTYPSPRKAGPFHKTSSFQSPKASVSLTDPRREEDRDDVYKDDKRLVHTGPNPLHN
ncbi:hypothetical protein AALP_AA5G003500 [Arabis alpina]|uniref:Uncharacterized protein n=1 Tax=Arabis alpina TaxID=50452 RepID=A0A087GU07_ARAAL|nr:hypothetical protein AALP_AA5G003500 [Arabis alpina]